MSDIDIIRRLVLERLAAVHVLQNTKFHAADDDNLWWFRLPSVTRDVQIESADGNCPFWVETDSMKDGSEAMMLNTVNDVVEAICDHLEKFAREQCQ